MGKYFRIGRGSDRYSSLTYRSNYHTLLSAVRISPASHWITEVSLFVFLRTDTSPSHYVYGYEIDEVEAVKHLVKTSPKWAKTYTVVDNHFEAMDAVAEELSDKCGLDLHALPLWVMGAT